MAKLLEDGAMVAELFIYMDDERVVAPGEEACWAAARCAGLRLNFMGIQDAARKRSYQSRQPGPLAGTTVNCLGVVRGLVSQAKWDKAKKAHLRELRTLYDKDPTALQRKCLEQIRGFLIYLVRTYLDMNPYLKGLHLTINGWRGGRDGEGWRLRGRELLAAAADGKVDLGGEEIGPDRVKAVPHFESDLAALEVLTSAESPPTQDSGPS